VNCRFFEKGLNRSFRTKDRGLQRFFLFCYLMKKEVQLKSDENSLYSAQPLQATVEFK
jgi:hypothetical protein